MSDVTVETIVAERVTDTGVLVNGTWWNFSKFGKKPAMQDGVTYSVESKEFKGKKYISKATATSAPVAPKTTSTQGGVAYSPGIAGVAKDKRILAQGIIQACLQSPGLTGFAADAGEYLTNVEAAADRMIAFVLDRAGE